MEKIELVAMDLAIEEAEKNAENGFIAGGPFGAVIVKGENIVASTHNTVLESHDCTAHAEINAIREASKKFGTQDLSGCKMFVNAEPCPMCLAAIMWANIEEVYYANTCSDAEEIGFRDEAIYDYLRGTKNYFLKKVHVENEKAKKAFEEYKKYRDDKIRY